MKSLNSTTSRHVSVKVDEEKKDPWAARTAKDALVCENCGYAWSKKLVKRFSFGLCARCGHFFPHQVVAIENYFTLIGVSKELSQAVQLMKKGEIIAAAREAIILFEHRIRKLSRLSDLDGADLMAKAFTFEYDETSSSFKKLPLISVNNLSSRTKRNEQEGIKFLAMGLMKGIRNIYAHSKGAHVIYYCLQAITLVDLLLKHLPGGPGSVAEIAERW